MKALKMSCLKVTDFAFHETTQKLLTGFSLNLIRGRFTSVFSKYSNFGWNWTSIMGRVHENLICVSARWCDLGKCLARQHPPPHPATTRSIAQLDRCQTPYPWMSLTPDNNDVINGKLIVNSEAERKRDHCYTVRKFPNLFIFLK